MYQIFKEQLDKSKMLLSGVKRNMRLGRDAGLNEKDIAKLEAQSRRLETLSSELDKLQDEARRKSEEAHQALFDLKSQIYRVKNTIKSKYDSTWWSKFGIPDKR